MNMLCCLIAIFNFFIDIAKLYLAYQVAGNMRYFKGREYYNVYILYRFLFFIKSITISLINFLYLNIISHVQWFS